MARKKLSPQAARVRRSVMHYISRTLKEEGDINKHVAFKANYYGLVQEALTEVLAREIK